MEKSVAIIGCGWLGTPLAKLLQTKGYEVLGTCQSDTSVQTLRDADINGLKLSLPADESDLISHPVFRQHTLILAFPPQLKKGHANYPEKVASIVKAAQKTAVKRIILVSSTGIYNGLLGEVSEDSELDLTNDKVKILRAAELEVESFNGSKSILRLSGLVGPKRHPGRFFSSGKTLSQPKAVLNLIHQQDAIGLLCSMIESSDVAGIYNGVSNTKAVKEEFYQAAARSLNIKPPQFNQTDLSFGRKVNGEKARKLLAYQYVYDDLINWV